MQQNEIAFPPMVLQYDLRVGAQAWRRRQVQSSVPKASHGQDGSFHNCILISKLCPEHTLQNLSSVAITVERIYTGFLLAYGDVYIGIARARRRSINLVWF